jgi:hypothetical protein
MSDMKDMTDAMVHVMYAIRDEIRDLSVVLDPERPLAATPTVEDAVVCGAHPDGWLVMTDGCGQRDCPGPHHTLLLGPEVTS